MKLFGLLGSAGVLSTYSSISVPMDKLVVSIVRRFSVVPFNYVLVFVHLMTLSIAQFTSCEIQR